MRVGIHYLSLIPLVLCCNSSSNKETDSTQLTDIWFKHRVIDSAVSSPAKPYGKAIGDLNTDGQPDLFISSALNGGMYWYQYPDWNKFTIRSEGSWSEDCQIFDIDNDGDNDIVNGNAQGLFWYENTINQSDQVPIDWPEHHIGSDGKNIHDLEIADFNGDGKPDVAVRYEKEYEIPVGIFLQGPDHIWRPINNTNDTFRKGEGLALGDLDHDGDVDMAIGLVWLENLNQGVDWKVHQYAVSMPEQVLIRIADLDKDGSMDIIVSPQSTQPGNLCWYTAEADKTTLWTEHIIQTSVSRMHGLAVADFNQDGNLDIHTSIRHDHPGDQQNVSIWLSNGKPVMKFEEYVLDTRGSHFSKVGDIDQDGDIDIFGANWMGTDHAQVDIDLWINQLE